jgi:hypothetical protein
MPLPSLSLSLQLRTDKIHIIHPFFIDAHTTNSNKILLSYLIKIYGRKKLPDKIKIRKKTSYTVILLVLSIPKAATSFNSYRKH